MGGTTRIVEDLQPPLQGSGGFGCRLVSSKFIVMIERHSNVFCVYLLEVD